jgi:hypothetical protein
MDTKNQAGLTPYYSNLEVKNKIDELLFQNAKVQANLGIDSTKKEKHEGHLKSKEISKQIKNLDENFAKSAFPEYIKQ